MNAKQARPDTRGRSTSAATRISGIAAVAALGAVLSACGGSTTATEGTAPELPEKVDSIAAMVPEGVAEDGTLVVAAGVYPPAVIQPVGGDHPTGWDIENARQIAAVLGLDVEFKIIPFDGVITGLQANRFDAAVGEIYVTPERTKNATFVTNHVSTDALLVPADSDIESAENMENLCGLTLAAQRGSAEAELIREVADKCDESGKDAVTPKTFQEQANVNLALSEGRIDAAVNSASQAAHAVSQTDGKFRLVEIPWAPKYDTGFAIAKNQHTDEFARAVEAATNHLIEEGRFQEILDEFNEGQGGVEKATITPAPAQ